MTPADEATFIQLWQQGATYTVIARALGIPGGTVGSRATRLVKQGKIQPRPRGGSYPRQHALARQEEAPARAPAPTPAEPSLLTRGPTRDHYGCGA
jgi:DNA-binding IclR family transcriptional regulator